MMDSAIQQLRLKSTNKHLIISVEYRALSDCDASVDCLITKSITRVGNVADLGTWTGFW